MKEPIRVEGGVKKMSASYFSFLGFEFLPNLYCKNSSGKKEQKTQKKFLRQ